MKIRFQADEDLDQAIITGVLRREPSVDFQTPQEARLLGADDVTVLHWCAAEGRILVSHDIQTIPWHFADFIATRTSPGVLLIPQKLRVGTAIESLLMIWYSFDAEAWQNRICYLPL